MGKMSSIDLEFAACPFCEEVKHAMAECTYQLQQLETENRALKLKIELHKKEQSEIIKAIIVSLTGKGD